MGGGSKVVESKYSYFTMSNSHYTHTFTYTLSESGMCIFSAAKSGGYFGVTLYQNDTKIASPWDNLRNDQYACGYCTKAFKCKKGDVLKFTIGDQGDATSAYKVSYSITVIR